MSALPVAELSLATLASLAELAPAGAPAAPPVTPAEGRKHFSDFSVTGNSSDKSMSCLEGVTPARVLPPQDELAAIWEERAAILEYEGGWPRPLAERIAHRIISLNQRDSTDAERRALDRELMDPELQRATSGRRA